MAVTLSGLLMTLVTTLFFAQNQFYADAILRSHVQENARSVTEFVAAELRGLGSDAFVLAESRQFMVRRPLVVGFLCRIRGGDSNTYFPLGGAGVDSASVAGLGVQDALGVWAYYPLAWGTINDPTEQGGPAATDCADWGTDTTGISQDFYSLQDLDVVASPDPENGAVLLLYQNLHYQFKASALEAGSIGLYMGNVGETLQELATGMTPAAGFQYRLQGESTYESTVSASDLSSIDAVRLIATAESLGQLRPNGDNSYSFGWTLDVILKNAR